MKTEVKFYYDIFKGGENKENFQELMEALYGDSPHVILDGEIYDLCVRKEPIGSPQNPQYIYSGSLVHADNVILWDFIIKDGISNGTEIEEFECTRLLNKDNTGEESNFRVGQCWSMEEEEDLILCFESCWTLGQISNNLGRSIGSLRSRLFKACNYGLKDRYCYDECVKATIKDFHKVTTTEEVRKTITLSGIITKGDLTGNDLESTVGTTKGDFEGIPEGSCVHHLDSINFKDLWLQGKYLCDKVTTAGDFFTSPPTDYSTKEEETKMQRRIVDVQLWDQDKGLEVSESLVATFEGVVTEDDDNTVIQQVLMEENVKKALAEHNSRRKNKPDLEILNRTGQDVKLREVKLKDLSWRVVSS